MGEEALQYLIEAYYRSKQRQKELENRLKSMNAAERFFYKSYVWLHHKTLFWKEIVARPVGIAILVLSSTWGIVMLTTSVMYRIILEIDRYVFYPLNLLLALVIGWTLIFSPYITLFELYAYSVKKRLKRILKEDYGIDLSEPN